VPDRADVQTPRKMQRQRMPPRRERYPEAAPRCWWTAP
jgi:hypothetical protein